MLLAAIAGLSTAAGARRAGGAAIAPVAARPNIVFVLTDDLSMDLLRFMPHVLAMERDGLTFENYFVSDSLCCPSRSSIFTGEFPHDTHVFEQLRAARRVQRLLRAPATSGTRSRWRSSGPGTRPR